MSSSPGYVLCLIVIAEVPPLENLKISLLFPIIQDSIGSCEVSLLPAISPCARMNGIFLRTLPVPTWDFPAGASFDLPLAVMAPSWPPVLLGCGTFFLLPLAL